MKLDYPIIDLHTHLRNDIPGHTKVAIESGINCVVFMANCDPPLDNLEAILKAMSEQRSCLALPVSAITKNLEGKEIVDIDKIKKFVVGFSDDGKCVKDLDLIAEALEKNVLLMLHCEPETEYIEKYLQTLLKVGGKIHLQHISLKKSVDFIRYFKGACRNEIASKKIQLTCETCPHYFTYTKDELDTKVNPPLALKEDIFAIREGLADGTIDVIASDYAPLPRKTGIAGFRSFVPLSYGLVLDGTLTEEQLKEKLSLNPLLILESSPMFDLVKRRLYGWTLDDATYELMRSNIRRGVR
ncbi:MAG: hypothetical protein A2909_03045 [Candidatus Tagabacteria bacterium RIFCSPLOWO2_01_FULL_39_11]|uniref:Amidohydrolase-related domain-containing protein n=1 Tax=Candidatus Tagabacteria bacterium RIFCSPLOWO2_01_FULL_39_11 TaxID=1802295 RepID=A0A1G2LPH1_9BACT|nr:MAG: hypothetical protein A2909_03045 [Candidatus Tagabacteria bacterium RIFCSPLOWO2_01_FULL_39_11]